MPGRLNAWISSIFNPVLGFLSGWALLVALTVFMVSGTIPAATATLALLAPDLANSTRSVTLVAAAWLVVVSAVIIKGIKLTSYVQVAMTLVELVIVLVILIAAWLQYGSHPAHHLSLASFSPAGFTPHLFTLGALTALFFFWGWDVTVNLNKETRDGSRVAGLSSLLAMLVVLALFILFSMVTLMVLSDQEIQTSGTNVVLAIAEKLFPKPWSYIAVLAVMLSTVGTLETPILQFSRTLFAQSRDFMLHPRYARLHPSWNTPWIAHPGDCRFWPVAAGFRHTQRQPDHSGFGECHRLSSGFLLRAGVFCVRLACMLQPAQKRLQPDLPGVLAIGQRMLSVVRRDRQPAVFQYHQQSCGGGGHPARPDTTLAQSSPAPGGACYAVVKPSGQDYSSTRSMPPLLAFSI